MSTTITFKLNKTAHQFQAGESVGFGIRGGVQYYDRETKSKEWTNYETAVFVRNPAQVQFYQEALVAGSVVEVTGKSQKIRQFQGQNGLLLSIEILEASIGYIHKAEGQPQYQQAPQQPAQYQPQPSQPPQQPAPFDDSVPF